LLLQLLGCAKQAEPTGDVDRRGAAAVWQTNEVENEGCLHVHTQWDRFLAAKVKISQGKYRESLTELDGISVSTQEEESVKLILMGQSYEGLDDRASAFAAYKKAASADPLGSAAILREGVLHYKMGDPKLANILLSRYVRVNTGNPEAFYYLFLCEVIEKERLESAKKVIVLDGPDGFWSTKLLKAASLRPPGIHGEESAGPK
jgi:tetratricopeptide (TPR) repeat protein